MAVFVMIRRQKTSMFLDARESTTLDEVKKRIEGILKVSPEDMRLYKDGAYLPHDHQSLEGCGFTTTTSPAQNPGTIGLAIRQDGEWEDLSIADLTIPPELPEVMRPPNPAAANPAAANPPAANPPAANPPAANPPEQAQ